MPNLNLPSPNGWNEWDFSRNVAGSTVIPDIPFAPDYIPSETFWFRAISDNCLIPFLIPMDLFNAFLSSGGNSPSVVGSMSGLSVVNNLQNLPSILNIKLGNGVSPKLGYCIGDKFHQQVYIEVSSSSLNYQNIAADGSVPAQAFIELLQNSKFKKMFVIQGKVVNYISNEENPLNARVSLGIEKDIPPSQSTINNIIGTKIKIFKSSVNDDGSIKYFSVYLTIAGVYDNWDVETTMIVADSTTDIPSINNGDFYQTNKTLCLEDPFMMSGFWMGPENLNPQGGISSGYNLYQSTHNTPFKAGKFTGVYIYKNVYTTEVLIPEVGIPLRDYGDSQWQFLGFGNDRDSTTYNNDLRYVEVVGEDESDFSTTTTTTIIEAESYYADALNGQNVTYKPMASSNDIDYATYIEYENTSFIRTEIGDGAYTFAHNWYAPCLVGEYVKVNGKIYEILAQPSALVLDISITDIYGEINLNPLENQDYEIINQNAWMLNEHYDRGGSTTLNSGQLEDVVGESVSAVPSSKPFSLTGIFNGVVSSAVESNGMTTMILEDVIDSSPSWYDFPAYNPPDIPYNTLIQRYTKTHNHLDGEPIKCYDKFEYWNVSKFGIEYSIDSIEFPNRDTISPSDVAKYNPYSINVVVTGNLTGSTFNNRLETYVTFDESFESVGSYSEESGSTYIATLKASAPDTSIPFILYDKLCLDGEYFSVPYRLNIPSDARIGCCEGRLFGVDADGTSSNPIGMWIYVTTVGGAVGLASLYDPINEVDWVLYEDPVTLKINLRRGSLSFKDLPVKREVVIGRSNLIDQAIVSNNQLSLNTGEDRVRRIKIEVPNGGSSTPATMFDIGSVGNKYGFIVSGDGLVDLGMLRAQDIGRGIIPSSTYTDNQGNIVSPVYQYKEGSGQSNYSNYIDIGISTNEGPIIFDNDGSDTNSNAVVEYIMDEQVLSNTGLFDLIKSSSGDMFLLYGQSINDDFSVINNSASSTDSLSNSPSQWTVSESVFIIGSNDQANTWGTPLHGVEKDNNKNEFYPTMVLNGVQYLASFYDSIEETLNIFVKAYSEDNSYIGFYSVSIMELTYNSFVCQFENSVIIPGNSSEGSFKIRPPIVTDSFTNDETKSWVNKSDIINDGFGFVSEDEIKGDGLVSDRYVRIIGAESTDSDVEYDGDFGIVSASIISAGTYMVFYDTDEGIKSVSSSNKGKDWVESGLIYSRAGKSGFKLGKNFFYIGASGIEMKKTTGMDFYDDVTIAIKKNEGENIETEELDKQDYLDNLDAVLIGSGVIDIQRLSGYISSEGFYSIFFYDLNNQLKSMFSNDGWRWEVHDNF